MVYCCSMRHEPIDQSFRSHVGIFSDEMREAQGQEGRNYPDWLSQ